MQKNQREYFFSDTNVMEVLTSEIHGNKKIHQPFLEALLKYMSKSTANAKTMLILLNNRFPRTSVTTTLKIFYILHNLQWDDQKIQEIILAENLFDLECPQPDVCRQYYSYLQLMFTFYRLRGFHPTFRDIANVLQPDHTENLNYLRGLLKQVQEALRLEIEMKMNKKIQKQIVAMLAQDVRRMVKVFISLFKVILRDYNSFTLDQRETLLILTVNFPKLYGQIEKLFKKAKLPNTLETALSNTNEISNALQAPIVMHIKEWNNEAAMSRDLPKSILMGLEAIGWVIEEKSTPKMESTPPVTFSESVSKTKSITSQPKFSSGSSSDAGSLTNDTRKSNTSDILDIRMNEIGPYLDEDELHRAEPVDKIRNVKPFERVRSGMNPSFGYEISQSVNAGQNKSIRRQAFSLNDANNSMKMKAEFQDDMPLNPIRTRMRDPNFRYREAEDAPRSQKYHEYSGGEGSRNSGYKNEMKASEGYGRSQERPPGCPFDVDVNGFKYFDEYEHERETSSTHMDYNESKPLDDAEGEDTHAYEEKCAQDWNDQPRQQKFIPSYTENDRIPSYESDSISMRTNFNIQDDSEPYKPQYKPTPFDSFEDPFSYKRSFDKLGSFGTLEVGKKQEYYMTDGYQQKFPPEEYDRQYEYHEETYPKADQYDEEEMRQSNKPYHEREPDRRFY